MQSQRNLANASKSDLVRSCGYPELQEGWQSERLNFTAFYEALLEPRESTLGNGNGGELVLKAGGKLKLHRHGSGQWNLLSARPTLASRLSSPVMSSN